MRCGYFDCFSGAAGDMILGALLDAGCPPKTLEQTIQKLRLPGVRLSAEKVQRKGLAATRATVEVGPEARKSHRHLPQIRKIIDAAEISQTAKDRAKAVFQRLAEAEAAVHGISIDKVHFHEVGAADAIVDIVCTCVGLETLGLERITCSAIPVGSGTVTCAHGVLPVPAPATAALLKGVPLAECDEPGELTTPTGAALLVTLADEFGPLPPLRITAIGYGAGAREGKTRANLLRLLIGETEPVESAESDLVCVLEAQIDDADGQSLAHACRQLLAAGALDAYLVPIIMKKGRPGQLLTVLCRPCDVPAIETVVFRETPTFGIRRHERLRSKLARAHVTVETRFGPIRVKVGTRGGEVLQVRPEYDDCAAAAERSGAPLHEVQREALRAFSNHNAAR